jgi:hypothetical protein
MEASGQIQAPVALTPGREPSVATGKDAGWAPESVWKQWRGEIIQPPAGNLTP